MKIKTLAVAATAFLHLKGPDGAYLYDDERPVGIELHGPGTTAFAQVEERQTARAIQRMQDNEGKVSLAPLAQRRAEEAEDLAALTHAFRGIEYDDLTGTELYKAVYAEPALGWIKAQVSKAVGDWGKFMPSSASS
jgi:hypothetical protein